MSKSKGNVITLLDVKKRYGADVSRFYLTSTSNLDGVFDWKNSEAEHAKETVGRIFSNLSEVLKMRSKGIVPALYVSKFNRVIRDAGTCLENMKLRDYSNLVVHDMLRLVKDARAALSEKELRGLYDLIADGWIRMLVPVCPHISEELWSKAGKKGFVSLASWPEFDAKKIDDSLEQVEKQVDTTVSDVLNLISLLKGKGTDVSKVYLYVIPPELKYYSAKAIHARIGKEVFVFANNDPKKHDPTAKSSKARPGRPAIYLE